MKGQFEVWDDEFPVKGLHPVVLISHPDRCAHAKTVNVLFCTSQRQSRMPYEYEVRLDSADGLNWESFCDCSIIYAVFFSELRTHRRRNAIRDKLRDMFLLAERD